MIFVQASIMIWQNCFLKMLTRLNVNSFYVNIILTCIVVRLFDPINSKYKLSVYHMHI